MRSNTLSKKVPDSLSADRQERPRKITVITSGLLLVAYCGVASASVVVCVSPSQPVHEKTIFSPTNNALPAELNTVTWHCSNGVSAPLPTLLHGHKVLSLVPTMTYNATAQPPYKQESYGQVILDWHKK